MPLRDGGNRKDGIMNTRRLTFTSKMIFDCMQAVPTMVMFFIGRDA
jgi:hypothetical protein